MILTMMLVFLAPPIVTRTAAGVAAGLNGGGIYAGSVYLPGNEVPYFISHLVPNTSVPFSGSLSLSTPASPRSGPANLSISDGRQTLFQWPDRFGVDQTFASGSTSLPVQNGTASGSIELPPARIIEANGTVESGPPVLTGPYNLSIDLGLTRVFSRDGAIPYLPFASLGWGNLTVPVQTASSRAYIQGSTVYALGGADGSLGVFIQEPGALGVRVTSRQLAASSVTALGWGSLPNASSPALLASVSTQVYLIPDGGTSDANNVLMFIPAFGAGQPYTPLGLSLFNRGNGVATLVIPTLQGEVFAANWTSSTGWPEFALPLYHLPPPVTSYAAYPPRGIFAIGGAGVVYVAGVNASGFTPMTAVNLTSNSSESALAFSSDGGSIYAANAAGSVFQLTAPTWRTSELQGYTSPTPITGMAVGNATGGSDEILLTDVSGEVTLVVNAFSATQDVVHLLGTPPLSDKPDPQLQSVYGTNEMDPVIVSGSELWGAESEGAFNSSQIPGFAPVLSQLVATSTPSTDSVGNPTVAVPVALTVHDGAARISNLEVVYNYTRNLTLSSRLLSPSSNGSAFNVINITFESESPGWIHYVLDLSRGPMARTPPPTFWQRLSPWWGEQGPYLILALAASGAVLVATGVRTYRRIRTTPPARTGTTASQSRKGKGH